MAFSCDSQGLLRDGVGKLEEIEKRLREKIDLINSELGGSSYGFNFLNGRGGILGQILGKFQNSLGGSLLQDVIGMFDEPFSFEKFMDLTIKYLAYREQRARLRRLNNDQSTVSIFAYEQLIDATASDAQDLIFISKLSYEELVSSVDEREDIIEDLESNRQIMITELDKLDADTTNSYYNQNFFQTWKDVQTDLLDSLLELNQADFNSPGDNSNFDHDSYQGSIRHLNNAFQKIQPSGNAMFNDLAFKSAAEDFPVLLKQLDEINTEIEEKKENVCEFLNNFKQAYADYVIAKEHLIEMVEELREIKEIVDDYVDNPVENEVFFREDMAARILALRIRMITMKQDIIQQLEDLENGVGDAEDLANYQKFIDMRDSLCALDDTNTTTDTFKDISIIVSTEKNKILTNEDSKTDKIRDAINIVKIQTDTIINKRPVYIQIYNDFSVRENPETEKLMKALRIKGYYDILQKALKGDWQGFFNSITSGFLGFSEFKAKLSCVLSSAEEVSSSVQQVLFSIDSKIDNFQNTFHDRNYDRHEAIERNTKNLQREIESLKKIINRAQTLRT